MPDEGKLHLYRVTVRGRFDQLEPAVRERLVADAELHEALRARFTPEGTFTYEMHLGAFSFRYELRERGDDPLGAVTERARGLAETYLDDAGIGHRNLRVQATDMADMWTRGSG